MKEFETDSFRMKISDDLFKEITIKKNISFSPENVQESVTLAKNAHKPDTKFFVLLEGEEGSNVSPEAKRMVASEDYHKYTNALALCSKSLAMAIAGNLFLKINQPKTPTRFFDNRSEALKWLQTIASQIK